MFIMNQQCTIREHLDDLAPPQPIFTAILHPSKRTVRKNKMSQIEGQCTMEIALDVGGHQLERQFQALKLIIIAY